MSKLIFPDGVRLATRDEIPGPEDERTIAWARIVAANVQPGFVLKRVEGEWFNCYAEANVDAPAIWGVFLDLCHALLEPDATLLFGHIDDELGALGSADLTAIINALAPYQYQLTQDGWLQFGVVSDRNGVNEVLVTPTKHLKIWLCDEARFRSTMEAHGIPQVSRLEFLDQFPRAISRLPASKIVFHDYDAFALRLEEGMRANRQH